MLPIRTTSLFDSYGNAASRTHFTRATPPFLSPAIMAGEKVWAFTPTVAKWMFRLYYADFLPDASVAILAAMLWRAIFYYPFLVMGTLVLPKWIAKK